MSYLAKQKLSYYRKFRLDIWGFIKNTLQVLFDNTMYQIYTVNKHYRSIKNAFKRTTYKNLNYKIQSEINTLQKTAIVLRTYEDIDRAFKMYIRRILIMKLIAIRVLLIKFMNLTISKRLSNIFKTVVTDQDDDNKIFFRRPFIYEARVPVPRARRRRIKPGFLSFRMIRLFYVMYSYRQLKQIGRKAKSQIGVFEENYLKIIESKLPSYLYRTALFSTIFEGLDFVKSSNVWINKQYKPLVYYTVQLFDIVGFRVIYKSYILWTMFKRLRRKAFMFLFSRCIYLSLIFVFTVLIARFTKKDMINSFNFDYYRVVNHAQ